MPRDIRGIQNSDMISSLLSLDNICMKIAAIPFLFFVFMKIAIELGIKLQKLQG